MRYTINVYSSLEKYLNGDMTQEYEGDVRIPDEMVRASCIEGLALIINYLNKNYRGYWHSIYDKKHNEELNKTSIINEYGQWNE